MINKETLDTIMDGYFGDWLNEWAEISASEGDYGMSAEDALSVLKVGDILDLFEEYIWELVGETKGKEKNE